MRRLIVNADDFGLTSGVNRAILECHQSGIVTSATAMGTGSAFAEVPVIASQNPRLGVGCHVVLVDGTPVSIPDQIPSLTNLKTGQFRDSLASAALGAMARRLNHTEIVSEASAQIRRLQAAGISVTHLDTHKHTHLFPAVLKALLEAARQCGIRAIRNSLEPAFLRRLSPVGLRKGRIQLATLTALAGDFSSRVAAAGLKTTDGSIGILATGSLTLDLLQRLLDHLPDGTWELICHPGYNDAALQGAHTRLLHSREEELKILTSDEARRAIESGGFQLISFRELGQSADETSVP